MIKKLKKYVELKILLTKKRLVPLQGGSLLFTAKFPDISGTHFTDLGRMKG